MKKLILEFTIAEARGLAILAGEGYAAISTDDAAAEAYLGTKAQQEAAWRAHDKLRKACGYEH